MLPPQGKFDHCRRAKMASFDFAPLTRRYACPELVEGLRTNGLRQGHYAGRHVADELGATPRTNGLRLGPRSSFHPLSLMSVRLHAPFVFVSASSPSPFVPISRSSPSPVRPRLPFVLISVRPCLRSSLSPFVLSVAPRQRREVEGRHLAENQMPSHLHKTIHGARPLPRPGRQRRAADGIDGADDVLNRDLHPTGHFALNGLRGTRRRR